MRGLDPHGCSNNYFGMEIMTLTQRYPGAAVVTGASAGIGESFMNLLAKEGFPLVLVARRKERLDALAERIEPTTRSMSGCFLDLDALVQRQLRSFTDEQGTVVGMVVNNAGFGSFGRHDTVETAHYSKMVDLNCRVPTEITDVYLKDMLERKSGAVICGQHSGLPGGSLHVGLRGDKGVQPHLGRGARSRVPRNRRRCARCRPGFTETELLTRPVDARAPGPLVGYPDGVVRWALRALESAPARFMAG